MKMVRRYGRALTADLPEIPGGAFVLAGDYDDLAAKMEAHIATLEAEADWLIARVVELEAKLNKRSAQLIEALRKSDRIRNLRKDLIMDDKCQHLHCDKGRRAVSPEHRSSLTRKVIG